MRLRIVTSDVPGVTGTARITARYRVLPTTFALGPVMPMYALPDVTGALPVDDQRVRMP